MRSAFLIIGLFFIYSYQLFQTTPFIGDLARDLVDILAISNGDLRLIGPKTSLGGLYNPPWYYYLFVPIYLLSGRNFAAVLYFNAFLHAIIAGLIFQLLAKKWGSLKAVLATVLISVIPLFVFSSRSPGNGFSYLPFLALWLIYYLEKKQFKLSDYFLAGLSAGFIASFHYLALLTFLPIWLWIIRKRYFKEAIMTVLGFIVPFLPLVLFELTHNFVMLKNTLLDRSYRLFINNQNIPERSASPKNLWQNLWFINSQLSPWLIIGPVWIWLLGFVLSLGKKRELKLSYLGIIILFFYVLLSRYQYSVHYLLPLGISLFILAILIFLNQRLFYFLASLTILISLIKFINNLKPIHSDNFQNTAKKVDKTLAMARFDKNSFNIVHLDSSGRSDIGNQYRYFFLLSGLKPKNEYQYDSSHDLLVFCDQQLDKKDLLKLDNYEIRQFGYYYLDQAKSINLGSKRVYILLSGR